MSVSEQALFDQPGPRGRRWIRLATIGTAVLLVGLFWLAITEFHAHGQLDPAKWTIFGQWPVMAFLLRGLAATLLAAGVSAVIAAPLGFLVALGRLSRRRVIRWPAVAYVELFRAVPILLLLFAFLILAPRFGLRLPIFWQLVVPIVVSNVAALAEIFRAGILSVDRGQTEAGLCVGLSPAATMRLVVLPQALRRVAPALVTQFIRLLKESTLGYVVSFLELLHAGRVLGEYTHALIQTYLVMTLMFVAVNALLSWLATVLQRRG
ncbi:amino acid ABC transporter permease [Micromonospora sp. NPDC047793]|uniref:amino acid ABC transporter permease n=1 Tax=unclassified Micromonospora TaxID=2617518 RepID=UPI0033E0A859